MTVESVLITGTTSGVGRALMDHYTATGARVVASNRRRVPKLEEQYPSVRFECVDVRAADRVAELIGRLAQTAQLPQVFVLNAGINRVDNDQVFEHDAYKDVIETNLHGVLNFVQPLTRLATSRSTSGPWPRHVIAISSMANFVGNPYALGYHTSKRALTACFDVWSKMYSGTDLIFQQVLLGPIPTEIYTMAHELPPWMARTRDAFSGSLDGAAQAIARLAQTRRRRLVYPWKSVPLYVGAWVGQSFIPGLFQGRKTLDGKPRASKTD
jgi:NAD(P)-dependent dehydrogenase (short-subunit alcohol dehydrogenase family)